MPRRRLDIARRLAADEPRTTLALAEVLATDADRHVRWLATGPGDRSVAVVVRTEPLVWTAYPFLADPADAAPMARLLDDSPAVAVEGALADVDPVAEHMQRAGPSKAIPRFTMEPQDLDWPRPDGRTRLATPLDLDALCEPFSAYELELGRTRRAQRRLLARAIDRFGVIVADAPGRPGMLLGAIVSGGTTPRYLVWGDISVHPSARGQGWSWVLAGRALHLGLAAGLGMTGLQADTNPMTLPDTLASASSAQDHRIVLCSLPDRWPGERRARRMWWRVDRTRHRRSG